MGRLLRAVMRVFALFVVASTLFGTVSAVVAAFAKRRLETTDDPASNEPTAASVFAGERFVSLAPALRRGRVITWFAATTWTCAARRSIRRARRWTSGRCTAARRSRCRMAGGSGPA